MAGHQKIEVDVEVCIGADKFWHSIRDSNTLFPKIFPEVYKTIEVLEGDGKAIGSIRLIKYGEGAPLLTFAKEKIDAVDDEKKTVSYHVLEGDILKHYKHFKAFLCVTPKGDGSLVKWWCEFDKASPEVPEPHFIRDAAVKTFKDLEAFLKA
nr:MLP-like protein 423 [Ipomoea trifida]GMD13391.1 MLP-like protein 423 [Ipomoea batatas]GMD19563.1 MLP-like protein 423 [Ipomoea batatas]GMD21206.1 MLP-like protein 423 [Ipomoea batatas]